MATLQTWICNSKSFGGGREQGAEVVRKSLRGENTIWFPWALKNPWNRIEEKIRACK